MSVVSVCISIQSMLSSCTVKVSKISIFSSNFEYTLTWKYIVVSAKFRSVACFVGVCCHRYDLQTISSTSELPRRILKRLTGFSTVSFSPSLSLSLSLSFL